MDVGIAYSDDMVRMRDQLHVLAVATKEKFPGREDVPTFKELGFNYDAGRLAGSRGCRRVRRTYALKKLEKAFVEITSRPEIVEVMRKDGFISRALNHEQFQGRPDPPGGLLQGAAQERRPQEEVGGTAHADTQGRRPAHR